MSESSRWQRRSRTTREQDPSPTPTSKPPAPIILGLARPTAAWEHDSGGQPPVLDQSVGQSTSQSDNSHNAAGSARGANDKPIVVLRSRDDNRSSSTSPGPQIAAANPVDSNVPPSLQPPAPSHVPHSHPMYPQSQQRHSTTSQPTAETGKPRLTAPPEMKQSVKIIDESFRWVDAGIEDLVDQTDFLVVGALGLQGSGKSTILSLLAGNTAQDPYRNYIFQPQIKETREDAMHQTMGIDMYVSPERIIMLDTQPALSSSLLDYMIRHEKKYPQEYTTAENCLEMQTLQIASFLMTVCHVILVVQDWFTDLTFLRSLLTAEMLRPHTHISGSHEGGSQPGGGGQPEDSPQFNPTVVFVQNKAGHGEFSPQTYGEMKLTLNSIFRASKLRYQNTVNMHKDGVIAATKARGEGLDRDVNLFVLPTMEYYKTDLDTVVTSLPEYRGFPSFAFLVRQLRNQIYSIPRVPMNQATLTEKNWFHFAARTWETVKKSQLIAEYNRLLP